MTTCALMKCVFKKVFVHVSYSMWKKLKHWSQTLTGSSEPSTTIFLLEQEWHTSLPQRLQWCRLLNWHRRRFTLRLKFLKRGLIESRARKSQQEHILSHKLIHSPFHLYTLSLLPWWISPSGRPYRCAFCGLGSSPCGQGFFPEGWKVWPAAGSSSHWAVSRWRVYAWVCCLKKVCANMTYKQ